MYFMKVGSHAKVMFENNPIVTITKGQKVNLPMPQNNLSMHAWICQYNIANWMQQKLKQRVLFVPMLWMSWSMHMDFLTHYIWIQTCLIRSGYIIDGSGHIAYKTEHSVQWAKFWSAFHLSTPRQKIVQVDWLILNNIQNAVLHFALL